DRIRGAPPEYFVRRDAGQALGHQSDRPGRRPRGIRRRLRFSVRCLVGFYRRPEPALGRWRLQFDDGVELSSALRGKGGARLVTGSWRRGSAWLPAPMEVSPRGSSVDNDEKNADRGSGGRN